MKIGLLSYGQESLSLQYISSFLKKHGHDVKLFFDPCLFDDKLLLHYPRLNRIFSFKPWILHEIVSFKPDVFGISILTDTFPWAVSYAQAVKEKLPETKIAAGGTHVTILPERVAEAGCFDFLVRGEGEFAFAELIDSLAKKNTRTDIPGVWFCASHGIIKNEIPQLVEDLTLFGNPDRSIYEPYVNTSNTLLAISARGCLFNCSYCHHNAERKIFMGKGKYLRRLTPQQFIEYLIESYKKYHYKTVQIYDEIFTYDSAWLKEFAEDYKKNLNIPYICLGHPSYINDEVLHALKISNCFGIQIGVQSLNSAVRNDFLLRREKDKAIEHMIDLLEHFKVPYQLDMIFGLPGDTEEDYIYTAKYFSQLKAASKINTLILSLQPQTDMVEHALESGLIEKKDVQNINDGLEGCRVGETGSVRDKKQYHMIQNYILMYKLAVKLPRWVIGFMLAIKIHYMVRFLEPWFGYIIRLWGVDKRDVLVVRHYIRYSIEFFYKKLFKRKLYE